MCLILHKPAGARVPRELIDAAVAFNRDGWGLMGVHPDGTELIERHQQVDADRIGTMGHSLGGHGAFYLAAYDERIKACVCNCGGSFLRPQDRSVE